jgi:hypothetical protein
MAVPIPIREIIVKRRLQGHSLASTAIALSLNYDTVKNIWRRYRLRGVAGLTTDYHCRKRCRTTLRRRSIRAACWLKRHHPTWGARRIRKFLQDRWPDRAIPNERSLQRGFREAGVHGSRGRTSVPAESEHASRQWMLRVLECGASTGDLRSLISKDGDLRIFLKTLKDGKLKERNKVLAVLARRRGIPYHLIARFLFVTRKTIASYCNTYDIYGCERLFEGFYDRLNKSDDQLLQNTLFSVLHTPPSAYGINRTAWRMPDLRQVLAEKGQRICPQVIR